MNLSNYIESKRGTGILSTAGADGTVNAAVYARPHVLGNNRVGFIMRDRLSRANLKENSSAHFLFLEEGTKSRGIRLHLEKIGESGDPALIEQYTRRRERSDIGEDRHLVTFTVTKALEILGGDEIELDGDSD